MKLVLDRQDLRPEYQGDNCSSTVFEHFTPAAQVLIRQMDQATFEDHDRLTNLIYPPANLDAQAIANIDEAMKTLWEQAQPPDEIMVTTQLDQAERTDAQLQGQTRRLPDQFGPIEQYENKEEGEAGDGSYTWEGCYYENAVDLIQCGFLRFCACGSPEENLRYIRQALQLIQRRMTEGDPLYDWRNYEEATGSFYHTEGAKYFMYYWLDSMGLTDHGTQVPGWLTARGEQLILDIDLALAASNQKTENSNGAS